MVNWLCRLCIDVHGTACVGMRGELCLGDLQILVK